MPRFFTLYISDDTWDDQSLDRLHVRSTACRRLGVTVGDRLYLIRVFDGFPVLDACLEVERICSWEEAAIALGRSPETLSPRVEYVLGASPFPPHPTVILETDVVERLRFVSPTGRKRSLSAQRNHRGNMVFSIASLAGLRELTAESAALLKAAIRQLSRLRTP